MRELFTLAPDVAHLNHGSFGAVPKRVQVAQQRIRDEVELNPMRFYARDSAGQVLAARTELATFLGADQDGCALVANATTGTAAVLHSIPFAPGDEIVITDHLYNAVGVALQRLTRERGVVVVTVDVPLEATEDETVREIVNVVRPERTKLVIIDQVASPTAKLFPVAAIAAALAGSGVPLHVDGAHAAGMLSMPVAQIGADFWVGNLHKWGFAPRGTAMFQVAPGWRDSIRPVVPSRGDLVGFPGTVEQQGTRDLSGWIAAPHGTRLISEIGLDRYRRHNAELAAYGQRVIGAAVGSPLLPDPGPEVSMRVIVLPEGVAATGDGASALQERIAHELRAEVNISSWHGLGLLRVSAQVYNTADEYDRLAAGLPALLR